MEVLTVFDRKGFLDYQRWQKLNSKTIDKINDLIKSIQRDGPLEGLGKPERLTGNLKGHYSRRIDDKNRLVYLVSKDDYAEKTLIKSCCDHYGKGINPMKQGLLEGIINNN